MTDKEYVIERCKKCIDSGFGEEGLMFYYKVLKVVREKELGDWISVKDRIPDDEDGLLNKLVIDTEGQIGICDSVMTCERRDGTKVFMTNGPAVHVFEMAHITHWMPLPEPPKEE